MLRPLCMQIRTVRQLAKIRRVETGGRNIFYLVKRLTLPKVNLGVALSKIDSYFWFPALVSGRYINERE